MQVQVARIGKPHGIRGEVTVQLFTDDPESRFTAGQVLDVEPATPLAPRGTLTVAGSRWNKSVLVVRFAEVSSRNDAEALRGTRLSAESEETEEDGAYYEHELVGLDVYAIDSAEVEELENLVGTVAGLQTMPTQDLLRIELTNGHEALVPFVEEIVPEVDLEEGHVVIIPPAGLLELNSEDEAEPATSESTGSDAEDAPATETDEAR